MDASTIRRGVLAAVLSIAPDLEGTDLSGDLPLRDHYDLDSADYLNLIIRLNETFGVEVPDRTTASWSRSIRWSPILPRTCPKRQLQRFRQR